jgi:hypothetical protein
LAIKCAECKCATLERISEKPLRCVNCIKEDFCCCIQIHSKRTSQIQQVFLSLSNFFRHTKCLYTAALGIEILCIAAAEVGENTSFTLFGYRTHIGIAMGYLLGYGLSSFATFATILGRYSYGSNNEIVCGCCSVLEQGANKGLIPNLIITFTNFKIGVQKIPQLCKQPDLKHLVKTSIVILITAESACIVSALTIDWLFYRHSLFLSIPLALFIGAFAVVAPVAYKKAKRETKLQLQPILNYATDIDKAKTLSCSTSYDFVDFKRSKGKAD